MTQDHVAKPATITMAYAEYETLNRVKAQHDALLVALRALDADMYAAVSQSDRPQPTLEYFADKIAALLKGAMEHDVVRPD